MNWVRLVGTWRGTQTANRVLLGCVAALAIAVGGLSIALFRKEQLVVLVPPSLEGPVSVGRISASADYKRIFALFFANLLGNVTPSTLGFVRSGLEPLLAPGVYHDVLTALELQSQQIREDRVALRFEPRKVVYEQSSDKVFVTGFSVIEAASGTQARNVRTYEFRIDVANHHPSLSWITTYDGDARTADQVERAEKESEAARGQELRRQREQERRQQRQLENVRKG